VTGVVLAAPSCPVERIDHPCQPRPVEAALVQVLQGDRLTARQRTTAGGAFTFQLPAGDYRLRATNPGARLVFVGSRLEYGKPDAMPVGEDDVRVVGPDEMDDEIAVQMMLWYVPLVIMVVLALMVLTLFAYLKWWAG
jgi:hypothetical protein